MIEFLAVVGGIVVVVTVVNYIRIMRMKATLCEALGEELGRQLFDSHIGTRDGRKWLLNMAYVYRKVRATFGLKVAQISFRRAIDAVMRGDVPANATTQDIVQSVLHGGGKRPE